MKPKRLLAFCVLFVSVTAAHSLTAAEKPAPQPTEQQKLKERMDTLEAKLKEAQAKADRAAMEDDYIERTQKDAKDYYEKAFSTEVKFLDWLIVLVAAGPLLFGLFGFRIIDRIIEHATSDASSKLREEFAKKLDDKFEQLEKSHAAHLKQLEGTLEERISGLEKDLDLRGAYSYSFNQALALAAHESYPAALRMFRRAVESYKSGRRRKLFSTSFGGTTLHDLFVSLELMYKDNFAAEAEKELADELYNGLEDELNAAALELQWLAPLVRERKYGAHAPQPETPAAAQAPAQKSAQSAKPQEGKNK